MESNGSLTPVKWNFHSMVVVSGRSAIETDSRADLLAAIAADAQLTKPSHQGHCFRIVTRQEVEDAVRAIYIDAVRAKREATNVSGETGVLTPPHADEEIDVSDVALTPQSMALGFQRLVMFDRQMCLATCADSREDLPPHLGSTSSLPVRVFLMVDYPATTVEVHALLLTGELDQMKSHPTSSEIPLLPLLDGVLLLVDPMRELRERRKSLSQTDERRKSLAKRVSTEGTESLLADKPLPTAVSSVFRTANPFVKELFEMASVGGLEWSDLMFVDVPCCKTMDEVKAPHELLQDLHVSVGPLVDKKMLFKKWVSSVETINIPVMDANGEETIEMSRICDAIVDSVFQPSVGVAVLVWAMREAVARYHCDPSDTIAEDNNKSVPEVFIDYGDEASLRLAISYDLFVKQHTDSCNPCSVGGKRIDTIEKALWRASDLPGVSNSGRKSMPIQPRLSASERSVQDTEFAAFATIPVTRMHLTRQLLRFEELLGLQWKGKLSVREMVEPLNHDVLPQRLASLLRDNPTVVKDYDEATDSLLVAVISATAPGRFRTTAWSAREHVRHRPALKDWNQEALPTDEYLTPRTALSATACVPLSAGELGAVAEKCSIAFPADQSIIRVCQTPHAPAWLSVALDSDRFGLRPRSGENHNEEDPKQFAMQFFANLDDGSQLLIREGRRRPKKPDGYCSINLTLTSVDGVITTTCSDGTIIQRRALSERSTDRFVTEVHRIICGKGVVVRVFSDASREILLPNGDLVARRCGEMSKDSTTSADRELVVDPETNALVERRLATGVVVVTHTDGSRATYHTDGTVMYATPTRSHVLITKFGFPDVCIDVDVNLTAQRHSNGERVAVTKGGLRTRSVVSFADGSEIRVQYNTKVVAEVNGRIMFEKPDGAKVVAKDSGRVEFIPHRSSKILTPQSESVDDADRDELSHSNVYYFNCRDGSLSFVDHEQNHFRADVGDGLGLASLNVDLAGVLSEIDADKYEVTPIPARAVINDPIEPFLLVLRGDGTGEEVLRERDAREFLTDASAREVRREKPSSFSELSSSKSLSESPPWSIDRVFVRELRPSTDNFANYQHVWFKDEKVSACFDRLKVPVATAYCLLNESCLPRLSTPEPQFTVVRRLRQLRPMSGDDESDMLRTLQQWHEWQALRETKKDRFKVVDPRNADAVAQEVAIQRKIVAAIKATRARKKAERQKQREQQRKYRVDNKDNGAYMETVQEGHEPQDGGPGEEDDDDFDHFLSEESGENSNSDVDVDVDDLDELMWTAFTQADSTGGGRLTLLQARHALVQVLGVGVASAELVSQLKQLGQPEPFSLSFDTFTDVVHTFRDAGSNQADATAPSASSRVGAAGSAAEAARSFSLARVNPSRESDVA